MNAEGAADAEGAAYAPLEAPYAPVSYAPNVEVGAGSGLVRAPASGHAPRGRRRGGLLEGVAEVVAPARAAARAGLGVRVRRALLLERVVRHRDVPSDSATPACCRSRTTRKNQTEKARDGVRRGARGDAVAVARPPIAAPRLRRRTRRWGRPRGARASTKVWRLALEIVRNARACVPTEKV